MNAFVSDDAIKKKLIDIPKWTTSLNLGLDQFTSQFRDGLQNHLKYSLQDFIYTIIMIF